MIVTIDGGSGSGKSYVAAETAQVLGWAQVHTGTLYRLMAFCFLRQSLDTRDAEGLRNCMEEMRGLAVTGEGTFRLEHVKIASEVLDSEEIGLAAAAYAQQSVVRVFAADAIRRAVGCRDAVVEGRDCGTILFPHAEHKFFFINDNHERQKARLQLDNAVGGGFDAILRRNLMDSTRALGTLRPADDAIIIHIDGFPSLRKACCTILRTVKLPE